MSVVVIVGTQKGAFVLRSDLSRQRWELAGPHFKGWKATASARDDRGQYLIATASDVYGPALHRSVDLESFEQLESGPAYSEESGRKLNQIWTLIAHGDRLYAGVDEAGLFVGEDRGKTWKPVEGLNDHETREAWVPGFGGLCAHSVLVDPGNDQRMWVGISAVGVFRTDDGGATWVPKNEGIPMIIEDKVHKSIGFCVHALAHDPDETSTLYRQDHLGMFRTRNGGDSWERVESGLPSGFGFPIVMDRRSRWLYAFPLEKDEYRMPAEGRFRVFRSRDRADSWEPLSKGLPERDYSGVLRSSVAVDHLEPGGVYVGSTAGQLHVSRDGGDSWMTLPYTLPRVLSVNAFSGS